MHKLPLSMAPLLEVFVGSDATCTTRVQCKHTTNAQLIIYSLTCGITIVYYN